jgi:hypothetical protein
MKKILIAAATLATLIAGTDGASAKKWTYNVIEVKDGKAQAVGTPQSNCNYAHTMSQARLAIAGNPQRFFNVTSEDDLTLCPKQSRTPKGDVADATKAN